MGLRGERMLFWVVQTEQKWESCRVDTSQGVYSEELSEGQEIEGWTWGRWKKAGRESAGGEIKRGEKGKGKKKNTGWKIPPIVIGREKLLGFGCHSTMGRSGRSGNTRESRIKGSQMRSKI